MRSTSSKRRRLYRRGEKRTCECARPLARSLARSRVCPSCVLCALEPRGRQPSAVRFSFSSFFLLHLRLSFSSFFSSSGIAILYQVAVCTLAYFFSFHRTLTPIAYLYIPFYKTPVRLPPASLGSGAFQSCEFSSTVCDSRSLSAPRIHRTFSFENSRFAMSRGLTAHRT